MQLPEGFVTVKSIDELYDISVGKSSVQSPKTSNKLASKFSKMKSMLDSYRNADMMLDISGFELSSKLGIYPSIRYLLKIIISKHTKTKVYLMPQSFGPFEYKGIKEWVLKILIRHYLQYPIICFVREKESYQMLKQVCPKANIVLSNDLVLENKNIDNIKLEYDFPRIKIKNNSVGFVPNGRLFGEKPEGVVMKFFCFVVRQIREKNRNVYLLCYASDDMKVCNRIKEQFSDDKCVMVVPARLSCFEYQLLSSEFLYVVAARYHAVVHAYKEETPVVVIGWAAKYKELTALFNQESYLVEIDNTVSELVKNTINLMDENYEKEKNQINQYMKTVQRKCCFDYLEENDDQ